MNIPTLEELLEAGAHFGHQSSRWHPKMAPFIFGARNNIHIIDVEKTREALERATSTLRELAAKGGTILFVGTKPQAKALVKQAAIDCGMPHVTERWLGGTITNFSQIRGTVDRYMKSREQLQKGELEHYTKMERIIISREIAENEHKFGGIETMKKIPDLIFLADIRKDNTALAEAAESHVPVMAICDTNVNPEGVKHVIPMNDDAVRALGIVMRVVADAVKEGKGQPKA